MPTQQDVQRLIALREARNRGMMGPTQTAALQEIERRMSMGDQVAKVAEPAMTIASSMVAEPLSGLAGIAGALLPGPQGQGADWVNRTQEALTYMPRTEGGMQSLQGLASLMQPVSDVMQGAEQSMGDFGYENFGPGIGAMMAAIPAAASEVAVVGKGGRIARRLDDIPGFSEGKWAKLDIGPARLEVMDIGDGVKIGNSIIKDTSQRGRGFGVAAYEELIDRAKQQGKRFIESDETVEVPAARVYEALERRGYKVRKDPTARKVESRRGEDFWTADDDRAPFVIDLDGAQ